MTIEVLIINTNDDNTATTIIGSLVVTVAIINDVTWCIDVAHNDTATIDIIDVVSSSTVKHRNDTTATNIIGSPAVTVAINNIARIHKPTVADNDGPTILIRKAVSNFNTVRSLDDASIVDGTHLITVAIVHGIFIRTNDALDLCDDDADSSIIGDTCITFDVVGGTCIDVSRCNCYFLLL